MKKFLAVLLSLSLLLPLPAFAADQAGLLQKIEALSKELDRLKQQMQEIQQKEAAKEERITVVEKKAEEAAEGAGHLSWLDISGDYRGRLDSLSGKVHDYVQYNPFCGQPGQPPCISFPNYPMPGMTTRFLASGQPGFKAENDTLMTNRFGLNLRIKATEDISVKTRLLMYKVWGHDTMSPVQGNFFADRAFGPFDGTIAHVPSGNVLRVDQAYATWANIADQPIWFSVGRRPSTKGHPSNLRYNIERIGTAGIPSIMVDYAFDGLTLGVAPDIEALPGAYAKLCYGRGFDSGFKTPMNSIKDTDFLGLNIVPYDTENFRLELQWQKGFNIFTGPSDGFPQRIDTGLMAGRPASGSFIEVVTPVKTNLGDIQWLGGVISGKLNKIGPGDLNLFASAAMSRTSPNNNLFELPFAVITPGDIIVKGGFGLLYDDCDPATPGGQCKENRTGSAIYLGGRYDIASTGTKIGAEYNHGSKYWIGMVPAADDMWTSKLGTRGDVYEAYIIQELKLKPIAKRGKAFFRLGYQYYKFDYTGSNNWVGAPKKIEDLNTSDPTKTQLFAPLKNAKNIYFTFDVQF
jgi:hypothetical protein